MIHNEETAKYHLQSKEKAINTNNEPESGISRQEFKVVL